MLYCIFVVLSGVVSCILLVFEFIEIRLFRLWIYLNQLFIFIQLEVLNRLFPFTFICWIDWLGFSRFTWVTDRKQVGRSINVGFHPSQFDRHDPFEGLECQISFSDTIAREFIAAYFYLRFACGTHYLEGVGFSTGCDIETWFLSLFLISML